MRYDASRAPDPQEWLELDESERIDAVIDYHKRAKKTVGQDKRLHAAAHVIESQVAMGDATVVPAPLNRLMREGLERHDAIHARGPSSNGTELLGKGMTPPTRRAVFGTDESQRRLVSLLDQSVGARKQGR